LNSVGIIGCVRIFVFGRHRTTDFVGGYLAVFGGPEEAESIMSELEISAQFLAALLGNRPSSSTIHHWTKGIAGFLDGAKQQRILDMLRKLKAIQDEVPYRMPLAFKNVQFWLTFLEQREAEQVRRVLQGVGE
jgi:hypothetical protein